MNLFRRFFASMFFLCIAGLPLSAVADWKIVDALDVSPLIPDILDALMMVATGGYEFFVNNGKGIIYLLVWGVLAITIGLYAVKLFFPKQWLSFFGFSASDEIGKVDGFKMSENMLKPAIRAIIAAVVLLQIRPVFVTEWLVNPFLQFGSLYTDALIQTIPQMNFIPPQVECPQNIVEKAWISESSCKFLVQPVATLSYANNQIVKRGFEFMTNGLRGLLTIISHNAGENILNVLTGLFLIITFVSCNIFMALLIVQAIFNFGMALILYPFQVLVWVAKKNDKWFDVWPAFSGIIKALQELIITMIACAFILCVNIAIVRSMFSWNSSVFSVASGGMAHTNLPMATSASMGFGAHSVLWLSSILTFFVMLRIFNLTRDKITQYTGSGMDKLYKSVTGDAKTTFGKIKALPNKIKEIGKVAGWIKSK